MSRKRVENFQRERWRVRTSWARVVTASIALSPGSDPHWFGWRRLAFLAKDMSLTVRTLSRILETVFRRTIMRKEDGVSYEGLPSLSRTTPFACFRDGGWYPTSTSGARRARSISTL